MIEDIKKEIEHSFDGVYLEDKAFVIITVTEILDKYKDIDKYKNAWEELKKYEYWDALIEKNTLITDRFEIFDELEQKYNIKESGE